MKAWHIESIMFIVGSFFAYFQNYDTSTALYLGLIVLLTTHLVYKAYSADNQERGNLR